MKSYSVKSNAKRFARGIAAKHPELIEAIEPVETDEGSREWWPAIRFTDAAEYGDKVVFYDQYGGTCIIHGLDQGEEPANEAAPETPEPETVSITINQETAAKALAAIAEIEAAGAPAAVEEDAAARTMAAAADLPPPTKSSAEEIAERRAARRAKLDAEKAAGTRDRNGDRVKPKKISKKQIIIDLTKREQGATQVELEHFTGWKRHTLRGYIAGTLRKILAPVGKTIECERGKGEAPTRYFLVDVKKGGAA